MFLTALLSFVTGVFNGVTSFLTGLGITSDRRLKSDIVAVSWGR